MKRMKAENEELKKELWRLQGLEDQMQLMREENEALKEKNAGLELQARVCTARDCTVFDSKDVCLSLCVSVCVCPPKGRPGDF